jgi:hypothetical protein
MVSLKTIPGILAYASFGGQGTNQQAHVNSNFTKKRKEKLSN